MANIRFKAYKVGSKKHAHGFLIIFRFSQNHFSRSIKFGFVLSEEASWNMENIKEAKYKGPLCMLL